MYAFKCSQVVIDGEPVDVFKQPVTASWKNSKKGRLGLVRLSDGTYQTCQVKDEEFPEVNILREVFIDGSGHNYDTLTKVRERAAL
jgi:nicotinamide phosphoribosyltransferase